MKRTVRLTEGDLTRIIKRIINEGKLILPMSQYVTDAKMGEGATRVVEAGETTYTLKNEGGRLVVSKIETLSSAYL